MSRVRLALVAAVLALLVAANPAGAAETAAPLQSEAWYQPCALPTGCEAVPAASPYPRDTLHVGTSGGEETARTYVEIDLGGVPDTARIVGGRLVITPAGQEAGTLRPEEADLTACLVTRPFAPDRGKFGPPFPPVDCAVASAAAFADGVFTVDLAPFASRWDVSRFAALALLPAEAAVESAESWRVAIAAKERPGGVAMAASLTYLEDDDLPPSAPAESPPVAGPSVLTDGFADGTDSTLPLASPPTGGLPAPDAPDVALAPVRGNGNVPTAVGAFDRTGFAYPAVWLLPLLLLCVGGLLGRSLSAPLRVSRTATL